MFSDVQRGTVSFEQLIDYVRSIEPDCDCGRFNCDCTQKAEEVKVEYVTTT